MNNKFYVMIAVVGSLFISLVMAEGKLDTPKKKQSYAMGYNLINNFKGQGLLLDAKSFIQGAEDALNNAEPKMTKSEILESIKALTKKVLRDKDGLNKVRAEANRIEGEAYLSENKKDKDVKQTSSGLQYKIVSLGKGKKPKKTDRVKVHYEGKFINGQEFDSSYKRGKPAIFGVTQVIPGWTEALQLMPVGSKFQVAIPGNLAYGEKAPESIGPNRTLLFTIELLGIE